MNEAQTEYELIEPALHQAGWKDTEGARILKQYSINLGRLLGQGRRSQPLRADYVLRYKNRNLAVIEGKARDIYYTDGVGQAKNYATLLNIRFAFATNGLQIYQMDMQNAQEGAVTQYPSPEELWEMTYAKEDSWQNKILEIPFETKGGTWQPRYYQEVAVTKVIEALTNGKKRILLNLATGTGKTAIAFQIAWKLYKSEWNLRYEPDRLPRILFLADRNILADQAYNKFGGFEEEAKVRIQPDEIKKKGGVPTNGHIFFTIFQTFMSGPDDSPYFGDYPPDFFDFIIIDECHRGGARDESSWRAIMDYFEPAVQLGLTATPKRKINADTYDYFGKPVYTYSLQSGINDGFLSPFKIKEIETTIDNYQYDPDDDVVEGDIDAEKEYTEKDFNTIIEIKKREEFRVKQFLELMDQSKKTLVFCATQIHAAAIRDLINQHSTSTNANYCHRVTANDGKLGEQYLRDFQDNEKSIPTILTTSQKLSTGVDAPEIRNIVLLRPVNSMIEFKQIVGRGTRLYDGKDHFTIYDFVKAFEHFEDPEWDGPPLPPDDPKPPKFCNKCEQAPCACEKGPEIPCDVCNNIPCICERPTRTMIKIDLSEENAISIDSTIKTHFLGIDGKPVLATEYIQKLYNQLPELFSNEEELLKIWSLPDTRKRLLTELSDRGYSQSNLEDLKRVVHADDSDLFDVLKYIAYHKDAVPRLQRAEKAKVHLNSYNQEQQEFLNFVLDQYVKSGVNELDDQKLPDLLTLKYNAIADAKTVLGDLKSVRNMFIDFQEYLYGEGA